MLQSIFHKYTFKPLVFITLLVAFLEIPFQPAFSSPKNSVKPRFTPKQYIETFKPICDSLSVAYSIPSEVILGIAMHESAYGNSKVCRLLNNHHGIAGRNNLQQTHGIKSRYRYFETDTASFVAFCELVKKRKYYPGMIAEKKTTTQWLLTIGRAGYCRNPTAWTKEINMMLRRNQLI